MQTNTNRAKVVFKAYDCSDNPIVVKWINSSALFTFQSFGFPRLDVFVHGELAPFAEGFLPYLRFSSHNSIGIDYVKGDSLDIYLKKTNDVLLLRHVLESVFWGLNSIYRRTLSVEPLSISLFNSFLVRDHTYMRQVTSSIGLSDLFRYCFLPLNLERLYADQISCASRIFLERTSPWQKSMCMRDLSLHNFIYDEEARQAVLIDTEDAYEGHFVFDLAWLSSSIYLELDPLDAFGICNDLFKSFIFSFDQDDPLASLSLYYRLLSAYLIISLLNPSIESSARSQASVNRLLKLINTLVLM